MFLNLTTEHQYGPLKKGMQLKIPKGYVVISGKNNLGKSSILQYVFKDFFDKHPEDGERVCFIPKIRDFITPSTETSGDKLVNLNERLLSQIRTQPLNHETERDLYLSRLYTLLSNNSDFVEQQNELRSVIAEAGFGSYVISSGQAHKIDGVEVPKQGSGIRCLLPIFAALSDKNMKLVIIDEPEASLEAGLQKSLRNLLMIACEQRDITIIVATHSHLFLNNKQIENNFILEESGSDLILSGVKNETELSKIAFRMYGSSLSDLYLPNNFIFVEGSSDQLVVEKVCALIDPNNAPSIRVIACKGAQEIHPTIGALERNMIPVVEGKSPYAKTLLALFDKPNEDLKDWVAKTKKLLGERCVVLQEPSLEEYLPEALFQKAGLEKAPIVEKINGGQLTPEEVNALKKETSKKIVVFLEKDDLKTIPEIVHLVELALSPNI